MLKFFEKNNFTLNEILSKRAVHQPQKLAYRFLSDGELVEEILTYWQLEEKSQRIKQKLINSELYKQNRNKRKLLALLLYPPGLEFICGFFGCLHAGVIAVPTSLPYGKRGKNRIDNIIKSANIDFVLTDSKTYYSLQKTSVEWGNVEWVITDKLAASLSLLSNTENPYSKDDIAFIQYTSGSTHFPKGVSITHGNLMANEAMIEAAFEHNESTIFVGWLPFFHDMGLIGNILQPLYLGIEATLMSPLSFLQKPIRWLEAISRFRATTSGAPNFAYDLCVEKAIVKEKLDLSSWNVAFSGSEPIHARTLTRFYQTFSSFNFSEHAFYPCYGLAEATLFVAGNDPKKPPIIKNIDKDLFEKEGLAKEASINTDKISSYVSVGHSWKDQEILIIDPSNGYPLTANIQGEICLKGSNIARGYWKNESATQETFENSIENKSGYFLRTGDLGFIDEKGLLYITSRLKDLIIIRGRNIIPQDIEISIIESNPAFNINGCAAFSISHEEEEKLVIVIEIKREYLKNFIPDRLFEPVKKTLSQEHGIDAKEIVFVKTNSIPKTSSGKVQRGYCKKLYLDDELDLLVSSQKEFFHSPNGFD
ncbi:fatty acyl-AMP ligase [Candidatus Protochlamydia sp. W-9]|uniref:fatty acyl-AMP ligase n=1 Tax=Candidatus Protochlamydia sp. W-9 TaxID=1785087 RepID=UPI00096A403F|nr:fatty acyl-AMP ligase [Candidatus Protochlamydia sp. W-9]